MSLPTLITISGTVKDKSGPVAGRLVFASTTLVRDSASSDVMLPQEIVAIVGVDGILNITIPSTNDPAFSPVGWTWEVRPHFPNWTTPFHLAVPYDSVGAALRLSDLVDVPADGTGQLYALVSHTHSGGGGSGASPSGTVASSTTYSQSSSAGASANFSRGDHVHGTPALPSPAAIGAAATAHTHTIANVTALQTSLDAKADASVVAALTKVLVLAAAAAVPGGTAAGTVIVRLP